MKVMTLFNEYRASNITRTWTW